MRWLSQGKVLFHVEELVTEVAVLLCEKGSMELTALFDNGKFKLNNLYVADIFGLLCIAKIY